MKRGILIQALVLLISTIGIVSCDKSSTDFTDDGFISAYVSTTVTGIVFDEDHVPVEGAKIMAHGHVRYSDPNGVFIFQNISVQKHRCFVTVEQNNNFSIMRSRRPITNGVTRLDVHLISHDGAIAQTDAFTAGNAYTINLSDGSSIDFSAGSNFVNEHGSPYTGTVTVRTAVLDATDESYSRRVPGGDQTGMDNYEEQFLDAHTGVMVELVGDNGKPVQLAQGSTAAIASQIPAALQGGAPGNIPVYYASSANGYSNREGSANENNNEYEMTVGHFSYWSTQVASPDFGIIKCRVIDASGNVLTGVRVQVGNAYGITGNNGAFEMRVPAGKGMMVAVRPLDFYGLSVTSPQAAWTNGEIRMVELQLPNLDHVVGSLVDCNNNPVEALVTLRWNNNVSKTISENGSFDLPTLSGAVTYNLFIKSALKDTMITITVNTGVTDLGQISLCDANLPDVYNYVQVNQGDTLLLDYSSFYTTYDGHIYVDSITGEVSQTYIEASGLDGDFYCYLSHVSSTGIFEIGDIASCGFNSLNPANSYQLDSGTVTITHFGNVGGFIRGVIDGVTIDGGDTVHIEFEVVRSENVNITY